MDREINTCLQQVSECDAPDIALHVDEILGTCTSTECFARNHLA
jgi:hypothetical protein